MLPKKQSPFVTQKKKKPPRIHRGVVEQFVGLGGDIGRGVARMPKDIVTGVPDSVRGGESGKSVMSVETHSQNVTKALYEGQSLTPAQREKLQQQDKSSSEAEIARHRQILQSFINRRKKFETPVQQAPSLQEQYEREEQQKQQALAAQRQNQPRDIVLPSSGKPKGPGKKKLKMQQKSKESKIAFKGAG